MKTLKNFNWKKYLPYFLIIVLLGTTFFYARRSSNLKEKLQIETNLGKALLDTVTYYKNSRNEVVAEKLTLQADLKSLREMNDYLTKSQKDLLARVKEIEKTNSIIAAALIQTNVKIDSLRNGNVVVDTTGGKITVSDSLTDIEYNFEIHKVKPIYADQKPIFKINRLYLPNTQFIEFHWKDNRKEGYPVAFSVSNSNKYFKTVNIDSYVIPEIQKEKIKPTFWQKVGKGVKKTGPYLIGGIIGGGSVFLLTR